VTKITNQPHHGAAEKVTDAAQDENPHKTTQQRERHESHVRHPGHAIKGARSPAQTVDIFRQKDRKSAKAVAHSFDAAAGAAIKAKIADCVAKEAAGAVRQIVTGKAAYRPPDQQTREAVTAEKVVVREDAREQQREIALNHDQNENAVQTIRLNQMREKLEAGHR